ncbi:MAG TPA: hypothetical protein VF765_10970 [Polyangiaceae bacterium]
MLKSIALLAPLALIVIASACGTGDSFSDEQRLGSSASEQRQPGGGGQPGGVEHGGGQPGGVERGGGQPGGIERGGGERGGERGWGGELGGRGVGHRIHEGRHHHGWINGSWSPGWGWSRGVWVEGGPEQISCVYDYDCDARLGPGVAVCDFDEAIGLGQCVAPDWY